MTPLHEAASRGSTFCLNYLLGKGADANVSNRWEGIESSNIIPMCALFVLIIPRFGFSKAKDAYDETPLHQAVKSGNLEAVRILIAKGINSSGYFLISD